MPNFRRWFRFSLRSLLLLVTLLCVYLGWVMHWIRARHEFRERPRITVVMNLDLELEGGFNTPAPWLLRPYGEDGAFMVHIEHPVGDEIELALSLFPEASVVTEDDSSIDLVERGD